MPTPRKTTDDVCKFNVWIDCTQRDKKKCEYCGWNPNVDQKRSAKVKKQYNFQSIGERLELIYKNFRAGNLSREEAHDAFDKVKISLLGTRNGGE